MRTAGTLVLVAALGGYVSTCQGQVPTFGCGSGQCWRAREVPGVQGPHGEPVPMAQPYASGNPSTAQARALMAQSVPLNLIQGAPGGPMGSGVLQASATAGPAAGGVVQASGCCPPGCGTAMTPPGFVMPAAPTGLAGPPGAVAAVGALTHGLPARYPSQRSSIRFVGPAGMRISWHSPCAPVNGKGPFNTTQIEAPGRYNFVQCAIYRIKVSNIPNRPGLELYPTFEVTPTTMKTEAFLAHSSVPINFTEEDFEQVAAGNFLVKVIYLPDPQFQDLATVGPDEVVSSRLEPGVDPIAEAARRGSILAIVRLGNIDLEAPNTPAMDAPNPFAGRPAAPCLPSGPGCPPAFGAMGGSGLAPQGMPIMSGPSGMPALSAPMLPPVTAPVTLPGTVTTPAQPGTVTK